MTAHLPSGTEASTYTAERPEWDRLEQAQNFLAKMLRQHDAGKLIGVSEVFKHLHALLDTPTPQVAWISHIVMRQEIAQRRAPAPFCAS
jgi:hypothetical protein